MNKLWQPLIEFGPLAGFFIAYKTYGLMAGTVTLMLLTLLALVASYVKDRRLAMTPLISGIAVTVLGGLTLALNSELFIKMKPTLVNALFAAILLIGWARGKGLLRHVMGMALELNAAGWRALSRNYGLFFLFLAALNEVIWRHFSTDFWVSFKVFGMLSCTLVFSLTQVWVMRTYAIADATKSDS
ncbi:MAG: septation protein IspZ [Rickettsiales bacterium]|nr:septation protein IspZ [Rickettsiales bacterium]